MWRSSPLAQTQGMMQLPPCTLCMPREPAAMSLTCAGTLGVLCLPVRPHSLTSSSLLLLMNIVKGSVVGNAHAY